LIRQDELFLHGDCERIWKKFCGFLDLSLDEYLGIQESLLMHQIDLINQSPIGKKFIPYKPTSVAEFRRIVPFTRYENYAHHLDRQSTGFLPEGPYQWACAEKLDGGLKWIPLTHHALLAISRCLICTIVLACAENKGDVRIINGSKILHNLQPAPYNNTLYAAMVARQTGMKIIPNLTISDHNENREVTESELEQYLSSGVDILAVPGNILYRIGEKLANNRRKLGFNFHVLSLEYIWRFILASVRSTREHRNLLPKDIWPIKGIISGGAEATIYQDKILEYWGKKPLMIYQAPEAGIIATQVWSKGNYTFLPTSSFHEFIPEEEVLKNRENQEYIPRTVLLNQVKPGKKYELVISSFYGMPFLRYRLGDMISITAMEDRETGIKLPQMTIASRADEVITIGDFCRIDEKQILQAIADTGLKYEDWCIHTYEENGQYNLNIYIELKDCKEKRDLEEIIETELIKLSTEYRESRRKQESPFLRVIELPKGSFHNYRRTNNQRGSTQEKLSTNHRHVSRSVIHQLEKTNTIK